MAGLQGTTVRLLAVLQEASDLARTVKLADGRSVGPILAAIVQDLRDPLIRPGQVAKHGRKNGVCKQGNKMSRWTAGAAAA